MELSLMQSNHNEQPQESTNQNIVPRSNHWDDYQCFVRDVRAFINGFSQSSLNLSPELQAFHDRHFVREEVTNRIGFINGKLVHLRVTLDATEHRLDTATLLKTLSRQDMKKLSSRSHLTEHTEFILENILAEIKLLDEDHW